MATAEEIDLLQVMCVHWWTSFNVAACDGCARVQEVITKYICGEST
jgi:hypothetical protein